MRKNIDRVERQMMLRYIIAGKMDDYSKQLIRENAALRKLCQTFIKGLSGPIKEGLISVPNEVLNAVKDAARGKDLDFG